MIGLKIVVIISSISIFANIILFSFISLLHLYKDIDIYPSIYDYPIINLYGKSNYYSNLDEWKGTVKGKYKNEDYSTLEKGFCILKERKEKNCEEVKERTSSFTTWKKTKVIPTHSEYSYLELLNLSVSSTEDCPSNLKQCGLLDTINNKMCIDKDKECPINMLIYKKTAEPPTEYNYTFKNVSFDDGSYLYYTNEAIEHHIISNFTISDTQPCIIPFEYSSNNKRYILEKKLGKKLYNN